MSEFGDEPISPYLPWRPPGCDVEIGPDRLLNEVFTAAERGEFERLKQLAAGGADLHARIEGGATLFMTAVYYGQKEVAAWLLAEGHDIDACDDLGRTALYDAVNYGASEMVDWLLTRGADSRAKTQNGRTPLDLAREKGDQGILRLVEQQRQARKKE